MNEQLGIKVPRRPDTIPKHKSGKLRIAYARVSCCSLYHLISHVVLCGMSIAV